MKKIISIILLVMFAITLNSCFTAGYFAGGKQKTYEGEYQLSYGKLNMEQSKEKIKKVLKDDGWNKTKEVGNELNYENGAGVAENYLVAKFSQTHLYITLGNDSMKIKMILVGNYNHGTEKKADEIFKKIKDKFEL